MKGRLLLLLALLFTAKFCLPQTPPIPLYECDEDTSTTRDAIPHVGTVKVLWIMCAPDSGALLPLDSLSIDRTNWCHNGRRVRVMYPSTYSIPSWADTLLDSTKGRSLSMYYKDQSNNLFRIYGDVLGQNEATIFRSDPDTSVRPTQPYVGCGNYGGFAFFKNIMEKVDAVYNLADYDVNGDGIVDEVFFHIYGLAEDGQLQGTGGVNGIAGQYVSLTDTTPSGVHIRVTDGLTIWSPSPEAYIHQYGWSQANADAETYWQAHDIAAHEFGHDLGLSHTAYLGNYDPMEKGAFINPLTGIAGPTSPYNVISRILLGWVTAQRIDQPLIYYALPDNLSSALCLQLPSATNSVPNSDQCLIAMASTREKLWEQNWPDNGVMIYHINPSSTGGNGCKRIDPELSSGLFDWEYHWEMTNPDWGCRVDNGDTCFIPTYSNTLTENSVSGLDSFDNTFRHVQGDWPEGMFAEGHWGTRGNYFSVGDSISFGTNPNSNIHFPEQSINQKPGHNGPSECDWGRSF